MSDRERAGRSAQLQALAEIGMSHTTAVVWVARRETPQKLRGGSIFFVHCGEREFAVTADHVYEGYLARKQEDPTTFSMVNGRAFALEDFLINRDKGRDLATFNLTAEQCSTPDSLKTVHQHPGEIWPPSLPEEEALLMVTGFPGNERVIVGKNEVAIGLACLGLVATRINETGIVCQYDAQDFLDYRGNPQPLNELDLGGVSGGPVWQLVESPSGLATVQLAGVAKESNAALGLLYLCRADCLRPDASIQPLDF